MPLLGALGTNSARSITSSGSFSGVTTRINLSSTTTPDTDDIGFTLVEADGSFQGSPAYYYVNSRSTAANRLRYRMNGNVLNNYENVLITFEYYYDSADNFATTLSTEHHHFRSNRSVVGGQSGRLLGRAADSASSNWDNSGGFTWTNTWHRVRVYHNRTSNTGTFTIAGYEAMNVPNMGSASSGPNYSASSELCFAQFYDSAASDNGISMRIGAVEVNAWDGAESAAPAFVGRFT